MFEKNCQYFWIVVDDCIHWSVFPMIANSIYVSTTRQHYLYQTQKATSNGRS